MGSSKGHIPGCGPLPHRLVESPGQPRGPWCSRKGCGPGRGAPAVLGVGGSGGSAGGDARTRCVDSPELGAADLGPGSPICTPGPGGPARFPDEDKPSSPTLSPYPVLAALRRIYLIVRTGPGDGQEREPQLWDRKGGQAARSACPGPRPGPGPPNQHAWCPLSRPGSSTQRPVPSTLRLSYPFLTNPRPCRSSGRKVCDELTHTHIPSSPGEERWKLVRSREANISPSDQS